MDLYESLLRPLLFSLDAERAHHLGLAGLKALQQCRLIGLIHAYCGFEHPGLAVNIGSLRLSNPVGLAAGLDKEGVALPGFASLGFGAIEVGTVTAEPQTGNPLPRIFRLPLDKALINRMGFPSNGAYALAEQLEQALPLAYGTKIGINIGKTKRIDIDQASEDYLRSFEILKKYGDYFVLNISSPNTPELRKLQEPERLKVLLRAIRNVGIEGRPLMVKIAPDLDQSQLNEVIETVIAGGASGIIATNTTLSREGLKTAIDQTGGLSGAPLFSRSLDFVSRIYQRTRGEIPVIGVGGIFTSQQVWEMMEAGASAVQIYTGFIYRGPLMVRAILRDLAGRLEREQLASIISIIGRKNGAFKPLS